MIGSAIGPGFSPQDLPKTSKAGCCSFSLLYMLFVPQRARMSETPIILVFAILSNEDTFAERNMNHLLHMKQWEDAIRPCLFYLAFCDFSSLERQFRSILHSLRCSDIVSRICYSGLSGLSERHRFAFLSDQKREISLEQKKNDNCHNCQNREKQVRAFWWRGVHAEKSFSNQGVFPIIRKRRLFRKRCFLLRHFLFLPKLNATVVVASTCSEGVDASGGIE